MRNEVNDFFSGFDFKKSGEKMFKDEKKPFIGLKPKKKGKNEKDKSK